MINSCVRPLVRGGLTLGVLSSLLVGCTGTDAAGVPALKAINPYAWLQLNVRAAVMSTVAPYDTLQLTPTAYDVNGNVIPLPGPVTYAVNDTTLKISASGLLRITGTPGSGATVIASVQDTSLNLTHKDTAFIYGTPTVPSSPLASFSIQPVGTDSAVLDLNNGTKTLAVTALDATGKVIPTASLRLHFRTGNQDVASIDAKAGTVSANSPGTARLTASTTYYGVTKTDSLVFRIGYPDTVTEVTEATALSNGAYSYYWRWSNLTIGVGKTVIFGLTALELPGISSVYLPDLLPITNPTLDKGVSVVFDDPTAAQSSSLPSLFLTKSYAANGSGNIDIQIPDSVIVVDSIVPAGATSAGQYSRKLTTYCKSAPFPCATARSFPTVGTYHFQSPTTGAAGTITVVAP